MSDDLHEHSKKLVETSGPLLDHYIETFRSAPHFDVDNPDFVAMYQVALGMMGDPSELAGALVTAMIRLEKIGANHDSST